MKKKILYIILCAVILLALVSVAVVYHNNAIDDAYVDGKDIGYDNGYDAGYNKGKSVGYDEGYDEGYSFYEDIEDEYTFFHDYAVITTSTGKRYHRYNCYHIRDRKFYIFNISNAESQGYTPCLDCYD